MLVPQHRPRVTLQLLFSPLQAFDVLLLLLPEAAFCVISELNPILAHLEIISIDVSHNVIQKISPPSLVGSSAHLASQFVTGVCVRSMGINHKPSSALESRILFSFLTQVENRKHHASNSEGYGGIKLPGSVIE